MRNLQFVIFLLSSLFFQYEQYMSTFLLVFLHMFWLIYSKQERFFGWIMILWHVSGLLYLYGHRLINLLPFQHGQIMILSEFLFIIFIIPLMYLGYKFKERYAFVRSHKNGCKKQREADCLPLSNKFFVILAIIVFLIAFSPWLNNRTVPFSFSFISFLFLFSIVNGFLEEWLWRGILLSAMLKLADKGTAVLFLAVFYGASQIMYGFSIQMCLFYIAAGALLGWMTIRSESFIRAAICHSVCNMVLILTGFIPFYEL